jgi:hypothetical protein
MHLPRTKENGNKVLVPKPNTLTSHQSKRKRMKKQAAASPEQKQAVKAQS